MLIALKIVLLPRVNKLYMKLIVSTAICNLQVTINNNNNFGITKKRVCRSFFSLNMVIFKFVSYA